MNGNGALQRIVRQPGIDGVEKAMKYLVAAGPENANRFCGGMPSDMIRGIILEQDDEITMRFDLVAS